MYTETFTVLLIHITAGLGFLAIALSAMTMMFPKGHRSDGSTDGQKADAGRARRNKHRHATTVCA
jgi:hypothetical protein